MSPYLHQTQNRIRVRSDFIQRNPKQIKEAIKQLQATDGIEEITHRLYAGSVAIRFDSKQVKAATLLAQIEGMGWLSVQKDKDYIDSTIRRSAVSLVKGIAILTLKRTVGGPLVSAVTALAR
ncbi:MULTISPECIES: HMA2 domain-containing protein [Hafnia]|uniref:HMA domain-containing protein n=2 Tax=Hafnia alvei TaxID=569 RepID=A0A377PH96_HAFAL|nr:hypothetical protein [Hafnia alvei]MDN6115728.1 hypothetical protein [Enterobacterales bacterium]KFC87328.1 hypothetical protein GHAL_2599 [Hafnia alvei ATCC 13337]MCV9375912.1 hypothetical protein [Hafnia alvei]MDN6682414.1 hypothetical protein [Enterobacterales bacterium]MDU7480549.1 hypothetical protein [Hafnia alvei]